MTKGRVYKTSTNLCILSCEGKRPWANWGKLGENWDKLRQIGANWGKLEQIGANWDKLGQIWARWGKFGKIGTNWGKLGQIVQILCKYCANIVQV